jgi:hypothetical protein
MTALVVLPDLSWVRLFHEQTEHWQSSPHAAAVTHDPA